MIISLICNIHPFAKPQHPEQFREYLATPIPHRSLPKWGACTGGAERQRNFSFSVHLVSVWWGWAAPPWRFSISAHEQTQAPRSWGLLLPKGAAEFFLKYTGWTDISKYNSQLTPVYLLHIEKRGQEVLPYVFIMAFLTSPFKKEVDRPRRGGGVGQCG